MTELEAMLPQARRLGVLQQDLQSAARGQTQSAAAHAGAEQAQQRSGCRAVNRRRAELAQAQEGARGPESDPVTAGGPGAAGGHAGQIRGHAGALGTGAPPGRSRPACCRASRHTSDGKRAPLARDGAGLAGRTSRAAGCGPPRRRVVPGMRQRPEHPQLARHIEAPVSDEALDHAREAARLADQAAHSAANQAQTAQQALTHRQEQLDELREAVTAADMPAGAAQDPAAAKAQLAEAIQALRVQQLAAGSAAGRRAPLAAELERLRGALAAADASIRVADAAAQDAGQRHAKLQGEWQAASARVPSEWREPERAHPRAGAGTAGSGAREAALAAAQLADKQAGAGLAAARAAQAGAQASLASQALREQQAGAAFTAERA
ncbi:hypothetical protein ACU4GD_04100 [Cupriavidus basilensis]